VKCEECGVRRECSVKCGVGSVKSAV
jgi:hypothetical protein